MKDKKGTAEYEQKKEAGNEYAEHLLLLFLEIKAVLKSRHKG